MMQHSSPASETAEALFLARADLEELTRRYITNLLTSQAASEDHARWLTSILDSAGDCLLVWDISGRLVLANQAALDYIGWNPINVTKEEFRLSYQMRADTGKPPLSLEEEPFTIAITEKRPVEMEALITGKLLPEDGVWVRAKVTPIIGVTGEVLGGVTVFHDISQRKRLQKHRDALATLITHDLKNHLAAEKMLFDILKNYYGPELSSDDNTLLAKVVKSNDRYFDIVRLLLELFRMDLTQGELKPEPIDLEQVLNAAIELDGVEASIAGVKIELSVSKNLPQIRNFAAALRHIFHNVLQNAIGVSSAGQQIKISARDLPDAVTIEFKDQGPGLSPGDMAELFSLSPSSKPVPSSSRSSRFGLYLCLLIAEECGGTIACTSSSPEGTTIAVTLPLEYKVRTGLSRSPS